MFVRAGVRFKWHDPTAGVFAFSLKANYAGSLHQLESAFPKMQVENVRLARQQVVANPEPFHRTENALDVSRGDVIGKLSDWIVSGFQRVQHLGAQLQSLRIRIAGCFAASIEETDPGVEVPTVIIKRAVSGQGKVELLDVCERQVLDVHEADHHVSDLHAGVVDVVLDLDAFTSCEQNSHKRIAKYCVADVPNVRRLVRIDTGVFDHLLWPIGDSQGFGRRRRFFCSEQR